MPEHVEQTHFLCKRDDPIDQIMRLSTHFRPYVSILLQEVTVRSGGIVQTIQMFLKFHFYDLKQLTV